MRSETKQIGSTAGGVGQGRQRSASLEQPITQVNVAPSQSILKDMKEDVENKDPQQQREDQVSGKIMTESDRDEVKEAKPHTPFGLASAVAHDRLMRRVALQTTKRMGTPWRRQTIREDAGASNDVASSASGDEDDNESREALVSRMDQLVLQPKAMSEDVKHELRNSQLLHGTRAAPRSGSMASRARPWAMRTSRQDADEPEEASRGVGGEAAGGASRGSVEPPSVQATAARGEGGSSAAASVRRFPRPVSRPAEQLPEEARHTGVGQARPVIKDAAARAYNPSTSVGGLNAKLSESSGGGGRSGSGDDVARPSLTQLGAARASTQPVPEEDDDWDSGPRIMRDPNIHKKNSVVVPELSAECRALLADPAKSKAMPKYDESYERTRNLILCGVPMALAKFDFEDQILLGKDYLVRRHTGVQHAFPLRPHETSFQVLRLDLLESLQASASNYFYAVPVPPCLEGYEHERHEGGGNVKRLAHILGNMKGQRAGMLTYSSLWTRRHYQESAEFFQGLLTGPDAERVFVFVLEERSRPETIAWSERLIHLPADSIQNWAIRRDEVLRDVKELAQNAVEPTIFLFNVGPLSPVLIYKMYEASSNHLYIDADGVLDSVMMGGRQRHEPSHYTGLPKDTAKNYDERVQCTFTRWTRELDCVAPLSESGDNTGAYQQLSPLCSHKGAHGVAGKMGRVGGFFPDSIESVQRSHYINPKLMNGMQSRNAQIMRGAQFGQ